MNILITGQATSGSWAIRGEQLGRLLGATVRPKANSARGFDAVVIVKRLHGQAILRSARWHGVPVIWDIVDAWPQPRGDEWSCEASMGWLRESIRTIQPHGIVAANRKMAQDLTLLVGPSTAITTLAHHAWQGKPVNPIRQQVTTIGYEGGEKHLGPWSAVLAAEAARRGWRFVVNPPTLADVDIAVALRRESGYAPRHWKSNVKLANAQASGTPIILARESGYLETASGAEYWADNAAELQAGLDWFADHGNRVVASQRMRGTEPQLADIADSYTRWLHGLCQASIAGRHAQASLGRRLYSAVCGRW